MTKGQERFADICLVHSLGSEQESDRTLKSLSTKRGKEFITLLSAELTDHDLSVLLSKLRFEVVNKDSMVTSLTDEISDLEKRLTLLNVNESIWTLDLNSVDVSVVEKLERREKQECEVRRVQDERLRVSEMIANKNSCLIDGIGELVDLKKILKYLERKRKSALISELNNLKDGRNVTICIGELLKLTSEQQVLSILSEHLPLFRDDRINDIILQSIIDLAKLRLKIISVKENEADIFEKLKDSQEPTDFFHGYPQYRCNHLIMDWSLQQHSFSAHPTHEASNLSDTNCSTNPQARPYSSALIKCEKELGSLRVQTASIKSIISNHFTSLINTRKGDIKWAQECMTFLVSPSFAKRVIKSYTL